KHYYLIIGPVAYHFEISNGSVCQIWYVLIELFKINNFRRKHFFYSYSFMEKNIRKDNTVILRINVGKC
ncbi:hypothetical protein C0J52_21825, partial [Blattella germanica]